MSIFILLANLAVFGTDVRADEVYSREGWSEAFSKSNISLGISLTEFREIPFPDENLFPSDIGLPIPLCSNDTGPGVDRYLKLSGEPNDINLIICHYFGSSTFIPSYQELESPLLLDWAPDSYYYFVQPENENDYILYSIRSYLLVERAYEPILQDFLNNFGDSESFVTNNFQSQNETIPRNEISVWENEASKITMTRNILQENQPPSIIYELKSLSNIVQSRFEGIHAVRNSPI